MIGATRNSKVLARKRFGQHFLTDRQVIADLVMAIDPRPDDFLVEIGPGRAALTGGLFERIEHVTAIELDRDLAQLLRSRFPPERLRLIQADALRFDYSALAATTHAAALIRLVGNLPYNISSPLLVHLIGHRSAIADQHFMLQKEVVDRIAALPGESAYGRLTVLLQTFYQVQALFEVGPLAFEPPPKVRSAVLRMKRLRSPQVPSLASLEGLTARAFAQKRKMLRNTLLPWLDAQGIDSAGIDPGARAEDIPVATYGAIALQIDHRFQAS